MITDDRPLNEIELLSEEDLEALRLGRELLKRKGEDDLHEVNQVCHKHLSAENKKMGCIRRLFEKLFS